MSPERADRYLGACDGDSAAAVALYEHNTVLSAAAWVVIADVEIVLRNIIASALKDHHDRCRSGVTYRWYDEPSWFSQGKWFTAETRQSISKQIAR